MIEHPTEDHDPISGEGTEGEANSPAELSGFPLWANRVIRFPGTVAILLVRAYQYLLSPLLGRTCRFHPSCSQYFILCVQKYGLIRGLWKGTLRISRCHPWNPGGYDPP